MSLIHFDQVTYTYGNGVTALKDVSLDIEPGEFLFLVGPSGSGKTTFLRMLLRELMPASGTIIFDGDEISKKRGISVPKVRRKVGVAFQDVRLLKDRTIAENVAVTLEILGKKKPEIEPAVTAALDLVDLEDKARDFPSQLSGGEVQRIGIARAVVGNPVVIFADEPTANLDDETGWKIISLLKEVNRSGKTVIIASHNTDVIRSMGERIVRLDKGVVIEDQKPGVRG